MVSLHLILSAMSWHNCTFLQGLGLVGLALGLHGVVTAFLCHIGRLEVDFIAKGSCRERIDKC